MMVQPTDRSPSMQCSTLIQAPKLHFTLEPFVSTVYISTLKRGPQVTFALMD